MLDMHLESIAVALVDPDPLQPRKTVDQEDLQRLADTIRAHGVQQPIRLRRNGDRFTIVMGERRWAAAKQAGLETIPAIVENGSPDPALRIRQLLENCGRIDLMPLDLAAAIELAITEGNLTAGEVARQIGLSEGHVSKLRTLLTLPHPVLELIRQNKLAMSTAYELLKLKTPDEQQQAAEAAVGERLTRDALARKLKRVRRGQTGGDGSPTRVTARLGGGRTFTVSGKSLSLDSLIEMLEQLLSRAKKSKSQGLTLATFVSALRDQATP